MNIFLTAWGKERFLPGECRGLTSQVNNEIHISSTIAKTNTVWDLFCCNHLFRAWLQKAVMEMRTGNRDIQGTGARAQPTAWGCSAPEPCSLSGVSLITLLLVQIEMFMYLGGQDSSYNGHCLRVLEGAHKKTKANLACCHFGGFLFG